ncbi:hypothetical protein HWV62_34159 [Athelia sp. TMB]|nr:hypothetical protein HWV62_34159 [Athelia sp. TMB]
MQGPRFGITNSAILGTLYLAQGGGNIVGSWVSGRLSDRSVHRWIEKRSGVRIPEDRLRASLWAGGIATPLTLLGAGLTMQLWTNVAGLVVTLLFLFINGIGLLGILAVSNTYLVDTNQSRSAEVIAANKYLCSAGASAAVLPVMKAIGIAPTNAIAAGFAWIGCGLVIVVILYGPRWRRVNTNVEDVEESRSDEK